MCGEAHAHTVIWNYLLLNYWKPILGLSIGRISEKKEKENSQKVGENVKTEQNQK